MTEFDKSFSLIISMRQKNVYGYRSFPSILLVLSDAKLSTFYTFLFVLLGNNLGRIKSQNYKYLTSGRGINSGVSRLFKFGLMLTQSTF